MYSQEFQNSIKLVEAAREKNIQTTIKNKLTFFINYASQNANL